MNELVDAHKLDIQMHAISAIRSKLESRGSFSKDVPLKTSNLTFEVFRDYCCLVGIDHRVFETRRNFINKRLVENRNTIAHGQWLSIEVSDFKEIYDLTVETMNQFKESLLNAASLQSYKR